MLALYNRHVTDNHLDVGVGTGYFLDRCRFPSDHPRLALMDLNPNCLHAAGSRVARYRPEMYRTNVLDPIDRNIPPFDSISMTYLLHCLPGTIKTKTAVLRHLKPLLKPEGVVFGATLLSEGVFRSPAAKRLMAFYNSKGIFTNNHDDLQGLHAILSEHFTNVTIAVRGCAALFSGRV
jgi:2-polyprenyl-3-methyl-5-hydroxy-6-metoxy-1,4-benzoquinol methylase